MPARAPVDRDRPGLGRACAGRRASAGCAALGWPPRASSVYTRASRGGIARGRVCSAALEIPWSSGWRWDRDQGGGGISPPLLLPGPDQTRPDPAGSDSGLDRIATSGGLRTRPDDPSAARPPPTCGRADPGCFPVPQSPSRPRGREGGRPADRDTHA
ncbi:unnamed protein product [Diplocarpon coronariae]